eukprot:COSAG04_NODE_11594_length_700_cov_0.921797_2_plen_22_part_01
MLAAQLKDSLAARQNPLWWVTA